MGSNPTSGTSVSGWKAVSMRHPTRFLGLCALFSLTLLVAPVFAECPDGMREFRGAITSVGAQKLFVDSRLDDNIGFERAQATRIVDAAGKGRTSWRQLRAGDSVVICWRFEDRPRKAHTITLR